uniref:Uncharacterized protein n=1 Tax=Arundo donax TaxID=35708 RepID=A0A0A8YP54_ARUDO
MHDHWREKNMRLSAKASANGVLRLRIFSSYLLECC